MRRRRADRQCGDDGQRGTAIIEFVFVAVPVLAVLIYTVVAFAQVQRTSIAVEDAARDAGRAFATADSTEDGLVRASAAARLAFADQGIHATAAVHYVARDAPCSAEAITPQLVPGAVFVVCVEQVADFPMIGGLVPGRGIRTVGRYVLHVDDYRVTGP